MVRFDTIIIFSILWSLLLTLLLNISVTHLLLAKFQRLKNNFSIAVNRKFKFSKNHVFMPSFLILPGSTVNDVIMTKPVEQTALSLLTDSFIDSSIVLPALLGISIASAGIYLLYSKFKTSTDSSNDDSNSDSLMEPVVDTVENLTSPDFVDLEFQKLEHICSNFSLFDFLYTKNYFMDVLNSILDFNVSVCLGFCFLQKILPYARLYCLIVLVLQKLLILY
jgi:hypothetical protein